MKILEFNILKKYIFLILILLLFVANKFTFAQEPFVLDRINEWSLLRKIWDQSLK